MKMTFFILCSKMANRNGHFWSFLADFMWLLTSMLNMENMFSIEKTQNSKISSPDLKNVPRSAKKKKKVKNDY